MTSRPGLYVMVALTLLNSCSIMAKVNRLEGQSKPPSVVIEKK